MQMKNKKPILLVEDEVIIALNEKKQLENYGYTVHHVSCGEDAAAAVLDDRWEFGLILMDIDLGSGIDGIQAAQQILQHKDIPVVFLSSHTEPEVVQKTEKVTSYGYVVKNSGIVVLDTSIKMALGLFAARTENAEQKEALQAREAAVRKKMQAVTGPESELQKAKDELQVISDNMQDLVSVTDMQGRYQFAGASHNILGYQEGYLIGKNVLDFVHPEDLPGVQAAFADFVANQRARAKSTYRYRCADGTWLWFETIGTLIPDADGNPKEILFNTRDISKCREAEEEIQKQLAEKEMLLREVHHRVKNNIATVEDLLSMQADAQSSREIKAPLLDAVSRVQSMRVLYEKLLLSKELKSVSVKTYAEGLVNSLVRFFDPEGRITVEMDVADFDLAARRAVSLGIIINELLTNVFKYAFPGLQKGRVNISLETAGSSAVLTIQDNGIGIDEADLENSSSGFGLTLVQLLVDQLKGSCTVTNEHGTKSVITFER